MSIYKHMQGMASWLHAERGTLTTMQKWVGWTYVDTGNIILFKTCKQCFDWNMLILSLPSWVPKIVAGISRDIQLLQETNCCDCWIIFKWKYILIECLPWVKSNICGQHLKMGSLTCHLQQRNFKLFFLVRV